MYSIVFEMFMCQWMPPTGPRAESPPPTFMSNRMVHGVLAESGR